MSEVAEDYCVSASVAIADALMNCGINFLAVDFDLTLISSDQHELKKNKKAYNSSESMYGNNIRARPLFCHLLPECLRRDIHIAVVTFNEDVEGIRAFLRTQFPTFGAQIVVVGNDRTWEYHGQGCTLAKLPHMAVAAEILHAERNVHITRASSLLLDDNIDNVQTAINNFTRAVAYEVGREKRTIEALVRLSVPDYVCS